MTGTRRKLVDESITREEVRAQYIAEEAESLKRLIKESIDRIYRVAIENAENKMPEIQREEN